MSFPVSEVIIRQIPHICPTPMIVLLSLGGLVTMIQYHDSQHHVESSVDAAATEENRGEKQMEDISLSVCCEFQTKSLSCTCFDLVT